MTYTEVGDLSQINLLMIGFNGDALNALSRAGVKDVVVMEEPEIWGARDLHARINDIDCISGCVITNYQWADDYRGFVSDHGARVQAVLPGVEYGVVAAASIAEDLGLPGAGVNAALRLRDKLLLRDTLKGTEISDVAFREVTSAADVEAFNRERAAVLKPADRQASLGVVLMAAGDDAKAAWATTTSARDGARFSATRGESARYLIEEFVSGEEVSTEALVKDGQVVWVNLTQKRVTPGRHPVEVGHVVAGGGGPWVPHLQLLVDRVGFGNGILHAEWRCQGDRVTILECAGRPPGDHILLLIDLAYDGNTANALFDLIGGRFQQPSREPQQAAAIQFITTERSGTVAAVTGQEEVRTSPGVVDFQLDLTPGTPVSVPESSMDRYGYIIVRGASAAELENNIDAALSNLTVQLA